MKIGSAKRAMEVAMDLFNAANRRNTKTYVNQNFFRVQGEIDCKGMRSNTFCNASATPILAMPAKTPGCGPRPATHSRESGNPFGCSKSTWIPAFAGMTRGETRLIIRALWQKHQHQRNNHQCQRTKFLPTRLLAEKPHAAEYAEHRNHQCR